MSPLAFTLLALMVALAVLVGILVLAVLRLRASMRVTSASRARLSEEAFMATAIQEARTRKPAAAPAPTEPLAEGDLERLVSDRVAKLASGLAHELANSLTALHGYSRMIDMTSLSEVDRSSIEAIQEETSIMSDTLDAFRRVVRRPELTRDHFELRHLVDDVLAFVEAEAHLHRGAIGRVTPAHALVDGDRVLLEEALAHVVRNSVEACRETGTAGTITVSATVEAAGRGVITVTDRGPGVAPDDRERLFDPFFSTKPKRAGFGLAFARHIVHAHGGTLTARHPSEGGLEVSIVVPLAPSATVTPIAR